MSDTSGWRCRTGWRSPLAAPCCPRSPSETCAVDMGATAVVRWGVMGCAAWWASRTDCPAGRRTDCRTSSHSDLVAPAAAAGVSGRRPAGGRRRLAAAVAASSRAGLRTGRCPWRTRMRVVDTGWYPCWQWGGERVEGGGVAAGRLLQSCYVAQNHTTHRTSCETGVGLWRIFSRCRGGTQLLGGQARTHVDRA